MDHHAGLVEKISVQDVSKTRRQNKALASSTYKRKYINNARDEMLRALEAAKQAALPPWLTPCELKEMMHMPVT